MQLCEIRLKFIFFELPALGRALWCLFVWLLLGQERQIAVTKQFRGGISVHSSLIGKIEKAKRYAEERDRVTFSEFKVDFRGEHDSYAVSFKDGQWTCSCNFFGGWKVCSHTMAMQKILGEMLPKGSEEENTLLTAASNGR
jgi:hypothetical protein